MTYEKMVATLDDKMLSKNIGALDVSLYAGSLCPYTLKPSVTDHGGA